MPTTGGHCWHFNLDEQDKFYAQLSCLLSIKNQSRTNGPINAHLTIAQVMPKYNHNNEKQEALL